MKVGRSHKKRTPAEKIAHLTWRIFYAGRRYQAEASYLSLDDFGDVHGPRIARIAPHLREATRLTTRLMRLLKSN